MPYSSPITRRAVLAVVAAATLAPAAAADDPGFTRISPHELAAMLAAKDFTLVNVHIPYEGEIAGTDAEIAYDTIAQHTDQLPSDKSAKIVLYCRSGRMSDIAARQLVTLGYSRVFDLEGGMNAWRQAGFEIRQK